MLEKTISTNTVKRKRHMALLDTIIQAGIDEQVLADGLVGHMQSLFSELEQHPLFPKQYIEEISPTDDKNAYALFVLGLTVTFNLDSKNLSFKGNGTDTCQKTLDYLANNYPSHIQNSYPLMFAGEVLKAALGHHLVTSLPILEKSKELDQDHVKTLNHIFAKTSHGIYFDTLECYDENGNLIKWDLYMAPRDLPPINNPDETAKTSYNKSLEILRDTKNWFGHDGEPYTTEGELMHAFQTASYKGGWFTPTSQMLTGRKNKDSAVSTSNMFAINSTLPSKKQMSNDGSNFFYTCTCPSPEMVYSGRIESSDLCSDDRNSYSQKTRPVRAIRRIA